MTIVQKNLNCTAVCKYCQKGLELVENVSTSQSLGRVWKMTCENEKSKKNENKDYTMTPKKDRYFIVNRILNFALRCTDKGNLAVIQFTRLMNLHKPISFHHRRKHIEALSGVTEVLLETKLETEALNCKTIFRDTG